jgi:hypothetical protein
MYQADGLPLTGVGLPAEPVGRLSELLQPFPYDASGLSSCVVGRPAEEVERLTDEIEAR